MTIFARESLNDDFFVMNTKPLNNYGKSKRPHVASLS